MFPTHRWCIAALCACFGGSCFATELPLPASQTQGSVTYVTGGIGLDEADTFRAAAQQYNLRITFTSQAGEYYASVKVTLRDAQGKTVIETVSDGPFVFFSVVPGKYEIIAENLGRTVTRVAQVREKRSTELYIRWKARPEGQTQ
jgi:hypothetical protein